MKKPAAKPAPKAKPSAGYDAAKSKGKGRAPKPDSEAAMDQKFARGARAKDDARRVTPAGKARSK